MLAVDTNIVVRYLLADDPVQSTQARTLIDERDIFVCTTVLLETEWVLRGVYGLTPAAVSNALRAFLGLPHVRLEDGDLAAQALGWMDAGMDFSDALHLAKATGCEGFVSFDRRFRRAANRLGSIKVMAPPP